MTSSSLPLTTASVIRKSAAVLYINDAPEPSATSVSIFGAPCMSPLSPLMKNLLLMSIMMAASIICSKPIATWLPVNQPGIGQPHIMCPIEKYMRTAKKPIELISLRFSLGVSVSLSASSSAARLEPLRLLSAFPAPSLSFAP